MSAVRLFGFVIAGLIILLIIGAGAFATVDRGMSAAQWIGLVILGLPTLFIISVGAVLTYVRVTTMGQSAREALPSGGLLDDGHPPHCRHSGNRLGSHPRFRGDL